MIYLDYSATTPVDDEVLDSFIKSNKYFANPNSLHKLGLEAKHLIDASTSQIAKILRVKPEEIIYTSGASESNNTVIKAMEECKNRGKTIITTKLEHSSISEPLNYLKTNAEIFKSASNNGGTTTTNLDVLKRLSRLEKVVYGEDEDEYEGFSMKL